jgi:hypothetical protein
MAINVIAERREKEMKRGKAFFGVFTIALCLSAMVASAAQATPELSAKEYPATLTGTQIGTAFFAETGSVSCEKGTYSSTLTGKTSTLKVEPKYEVCQSSGFPVTVDITSTGCYYTMKAKEKLAEGLYSGTFGFICEAGKYMQINAYLNESHSILICQVKIFSQVGPYNKVIFSNFEEGGKKKIEVTTEIEGFTYTQEGAFCPSGGFKNGALDSVAVFSAKNKGGEAINLEVTGA